MGVFVLLLFVLGIYLAAMGAVKKGRARHYERTRTKSEGERMANKYVQLHEKKLHDDTAYDQYLDWCKFHGELALPKTDFEKFRSNERDYELSIKKAMK